MAWSLPQLDIFVAALLALGVCILVVALVYAFFGVINGTFGRLPVVGGWISASSHHIAQRITNTMGKAIAKLEIVVGASWHGMARIVDKLGHELAAHAGLLGTIAQFLPGAGVIANLYGLVHDARLLVTKLAHEIAGIGAAAGAGAKAITKVVNRNVLPRLGRLEREYDHIISKDIAGLRGQVKTAEDAATKAWDYVRSHPWTVVTDAFVGAVAIALTRLGLDWIKCNTAKSVFKKHGCSLWSKLDDLLGVVGFLVIGFDFKEFVAAAEFVASGIGEAVAGIEGTFGLALPPLPPPQD